MDLANNPVVEVEGYREKVFEMFPDLAVLDNYDREGEEYISEDDEEGEDYGAEGGEDELELIGKGWIEHAMTLVGEWQR